MSERRDWSRRDLIGTALLGAGLAGPASAQEAEPTDRGIGGTGVVPDQAGNDDRGIGGTGVIGTIRRFGSIVVNGLRITFPRSVRVRIDGRQAHLRNLEIGHVVQVLAHRRADRFETRMIDVVSEVVGPVEAVTERGFTVLGQTVVLADTARRAWPVGRWVAVSGLRRLDGTIVASLVGRGRRGAAQVVGVASREPDGTMRIEGLPIRGLSDEAAGQRIRVTGQLRGGSLHLDQAVRQWSTLLAAGPTHLSIEDYVALDRNAVRLGSGVPVGGETAGALAPEGTRAILTASVAPDGAIRIDHVHLDGREPSQSSRPGPHGTDRPDGHRYGAFGDAPHEPATARPAHAGPPSSERGSFGERGIGAPGNGHAAGQSPGGGGSPSGPGSGGRTGGSPGGSHR